MKERPPRGGQIGCSIMSASGSRAEVTAWQHDVRFTPGAGVSPNPVEVRLGGVVECDAAQLEQGSWHSKDASAVR